MRALPAVSRPHPSQIKRRTPLSRMATIPAAGSTGPHTGTDPVASEQGAAALPPVAEMPHVSMLAKSCPCLR